MRGEGERSGVVGILEATAEGTKPRWRRTAGLSHESQLFASLHARPHRGGLS